MSLNQNWNDLDGAQFLGSPGSFSFVSGLSPLFTFSRASNATYWNGSAIVSAGTNVPRFEPAGGPLGGYGLLIEATSTNSFLNSQSPATQNITTTAQSYTISGFGAVGATITLSGTATGTLTGTGAGNLVQLTVTASAGTLTCTVSGSWNNVNVEPGTFATSRIITAGSVATRAVDQLSLALSNVPWWQQSGGMTAVLECDLFTTAAGVHLGVCGVGGYGSSIYVVTIGGGNVSLANSNNSTNSGGIALPAAGTKTKIGQSLVPGGNSLLAVNGQAPVSVATPTVPPLTTMGLLCSPWGMDNQPGGHAHSLNLLPYPASAAQLQALST